MALSTIESDVYVNGSLYAKTFTMPSGVVVNDSVSATAAIAASKLQHQHQITTPLTDHATDAAVVRKVLHRVKGATATLVEFGVGATVAAGSATTVTVDLLKNGSSILSATISLDIATSAFTLKTPSGYTSTALVAGDVLEVNVSAVTGANEPKGLFTALTIREDAA